MSDVVAPHYPWAIRWNLGFSAITSLHSRLTVVDARDVALFFGELIDGIHQAIDIVEASEEQNPEPVAQFMADASQQAVDKNQHFLILFDALDRLSTDWSLMDSMVRDLLRVVLWLKPYPRLSAKVFLREDQLERTVTDFPDASKLLSGAFMGA